MIPRRKNAGFSLVEIAIVLAIMGMIGSVMLAAWTTQLSNSNIKATIAKQENIKTALITFIARNSRLPCPAVATAAPADANYGVEAPTPGTCTGTTTIGSSVRGVIPWITLGLPDDGASDAYLRRYTYQVTLVETNRTAATLAEMRGTMTLHSTAPIALGLPPTGNQINSCSTTAGDNSCNLQAAVVIISHGPNGGGAFLPSGGQMAMPTGALELQNVTNSENFVRADVSENSANAFDDVVMALSPDDLLGPLSRQGAVESARSITNTQLRVLQDSLVAEIVNAGGSIPVVPAAPLPNDGWGRALTYNRMLVSACYTSPGQAAFKLTSLGVDGVLGPNPATGGQNDDISLTQSNDQLKLIIMKQGSSCP